MLLLGALPIHGVLQTAWHAVFLSTGQLVSARIDPLGAPTTSLQVKIITPHLSCGPEVTIDIEASSLQDEIKQKLVEATGVPFEHQKVMLSGINQIVMGDKRCDYLEGVVAATRGVACTSCAPCWATLHATKSSMLDFNL